MAALITFSSDYGPFDEFVGVCRLVIARIAPDVRVIDVVHGIGGIRGVRAGSAILAQSLPDAPNDAVHLCVVDPGVGTERRGVVILCGDGGFLVGPDNGLFFPVVDVLGGVIAAYELKEPWFRSERISATFHGRDVFAPAAAHLALGVSPHEFGPSIVPADLVRLDPAFVRTSIGEISSEVVRVDWFGNLQLAATAEDLVASGLEGAVEIRCETGTFLAAIAEKFADVEPGQLLVYVNSAGHIAIARNTGHANDLLGTPAVVTIAAG